jgi:hypothetical protein
MPSKSDNCGDWNFRIRTVRHPDRIALKDRVEMLSRGRRETTTEFWLRALSREVLRCQAELENGPVEDRIAADDLAETKVLALLTEEEKREYLL